jgi:hypothetical protein
VVGEWRGNGHRDLGPNWDREFTLAEVKLLDADAVRVGDGFDYRYHRGGRITWFSVRSGEELEVTELSGLPDDGWWHLEGCACGACSPSAPDTRLNPPSSEERVDARAADERGAGHPSQTSDDRGGEPQSSAPDEGA